MAQLNLSIAPLQFPSLVQMRGLVTTIIEQARFHALGTTPH